MRYYDTDGTRKTYHRASGAGKRRRMQSHNAGANPDNPDRPKVIPASVLLERAIDKVLGTHNAPPPILGEDVKDAPSGVYSFFVANAKGEDISPRLPTYHAAAQFRQGLRIPEALIVAERIPRLGLSGQRDWA